MKHTRQAIVGGNPCLKSLLRTMVFLIMVSAGSPASAVCFNPAVVTSSDYIRWT